MISSVTADYSLYLSAVPFRDVTTSQMVSYVERCTLFNGEKRAKMIFRSLVLLCFVFFFLLFFFSLFKPGLIWN